MSSSLPPVPALLGKASAVFVSKREMLSKSLLSDNARGLNRPKFLDSNTVNDNELESSTNSNVESSRVQMIINLEPDTLEPKLRAIKRFLFNGHKSCDQYFTAEEGTIESSPDCVPKIIKSVSPITPGENICPEVRNDLLAPPTSYRCCRNRGKHVALPLNVFTKPAKKEKRITSKKHSIPAILETVPFVNELKDATNEFKFNNGNMPVECGTSKGERAELELSEHAPKAKHVDIEKCCNSPEAVGTLVHGSDVLTHETLDNTPDISMAEGIEVFPLDSPNDSETFEDRVHALIRRSALSLTLPANLEIFDPEVVKQVLPLEVAGDGLNFEDRVREMVNRSLSLSSGSHSTPPLCSQHTPLSQTPVELERSNTKRKGEHSLLLYIYNDQSFEERVGQVIRASMSPPSEVRSPPVSHPENTASAPIPVEYLQFYCAACASALCHTFSKVCPGCGPNSAVRYCSKHCQFSDVNHWRICGRSSLNILSTVPAIPHVFELQPLQLEFINPSSFAQSLYMRNDPEVDYFVLTKPTPNTFPQMMFLYLKAHLPGASFNEMAFYLADQLEAEFGYDMKCWIGKAVPEQSEWLEMKEYLRSLEGAEVCHGVNKYGV
ncbi:hypothetical protein RUND412_009689 [Rhizina undulata]